MQKIFIIFVLLLVSSFASASTIDDQLQDAAKIGDVSTIKRLVKEGANVNSTNKHGESPLLIATNWNKLGAVKTLLELGADPKYHRGGESALFIATGRDTEIVRVLIQAGADVNLTTEKYNYSPLGSAAAYREDAFIGLTKSGSYSGPFPNSTETVRLLIKAGANVNHIDGDRMSPLRIAMENNNIEIARLLLEAGADVNQRIPSEDGAERGDTILMDTVGYYSLFKNISAIKLLLDFKANPNDRNELEYNEESELRGEGWRGYSVLGCAARGGWKEVVELLLSYGADPTLPRTDGKSPLKLAIENKHRQTAALIEDAIKKRYKTP